MTQINYTEPITNVTHWYRSLDQKMVKVVQIYSLLNGSVARSTVIGWLSGFTTARKPQQLEAISIVSEIPVDKLYEFRKNDNE